MSAETQLNALLLAANDVTSIVGTKIFHGVVTDEDTPAISYMRDGTEFNTTVSGHAHEGANKVLLNIFCVANEVGKADLLANKVCALQELVKINRSTTYDFDSELYAVVVTIELWE